ncbi:MAG: hypothetical protein J0M07_26375 [Anaerolineae bacterium]|nr:hypothetical protein [Anaerolineae bacterium]
MEAPSKPTPAIQYLPPSREAVQAFAQAVCAALAQTRNDPALESKESVKGLTHFLEVVTRIQAQYLSATNGELIDTETKSE